MRNSLLLDKLIDHIQKKLYIIEEEEMKELHILSEEIAIRTSLKLIQHPLPPMPDYSINPSYKDGQELADMVDDILSSVSAESESESESEYSESNRDDDKLLNGKRDTTGNGMGNGNSIGLDDDSMKNMIKEEKKSIDAMDSMTLSDAEASALCMQYKKEYNVDPGVSWGTLPYDLQEKWIQYSCDYHI